MKSKLDNKHKEVSYPKYRIWDGKKMTTEGIVFNKETGELDYPDNTCLLHSTNLYEKDTKKRVFECDVFEAKIGFYDETAVTKVFYVNPFMQNLFIKELAIDSDFETIPVSKFMGHDIKIIGNEFENPELVFGSKYVTSNPVHCEIDHIVNEEDLKNNPELSENGVKLGDTIQIPNE